MVNGRTLILVNPQSVSLRRSRAWAEIREAADAEHVVLVETRHAGHAGEYCRQHACEFDKVIAVGGDGTLMDVVNGCIDADVTVAPLPAGSGCDFVKAADGYPMSLAALLAAQGRRRIDVGRITFSDGGTHYFLTEAGVGLDAASLGYIPNWLRPISAKRAYDVGALRGILWFRPFRARVTIDDDEIEFPRMQLLAVCNATYFGDGMPIAPDAKIDDGVLHVYALGGASRWEIIRSFRRIRDGTHVDHPKSIYRACRTVRIEADRPLEMCVDGDLIRRTPRQWDILPGRLEIIAPDGP